MSALGWRERRSAKGLRHIERQLKLGLTAQEYRATLRAAKKARKEAWASELAKMSAERLAREEALS